jgi:hypothetical protein
MDNQYYLFKKATKTMKEIRLNKKSFSGGIADMRYSKVDVDKNKDMMLKMKKIWQLL